MSTQHVQASECFVHDRARLMEAVHLFPKKWALRRLVHVRARKIRQCTPYLGPARPCTNATCSGILLMTISPSAATLTSFLRISNWDITSNCLACLLPSLSWSLHRPSLQRTSTTAMKKPRSSVCGSPRIRSHVLAFCYSLPLSPRAPPAIGELYCLRSS